MRDYRHPHLVEQGETFPHVAAQDQEPGLCDSSDRARRRVASRTDVIAPCPLSRARQIARQQPLVRPDCRKPRVRRRLTLTLSSRSALPNQPRTGAIRRYREAGASRRELPRLRLTWSPASQALCMTRSHVSIGLVEVARGVGDLAEKR